MPAKLDIEVIALDETATSIKGRFPSGTLDPKNAVREIVNLAHKLARGGNRGRLRIKIDDSTGVKATGTIACVQANLAAADAVEIAGVRLVMVTGAADATLGQVSKDTSDNAVAASLNAAINGYRPLKGIVTSTVASATVTVTAYEPGTVGNGITLKKILANAAGLTLSGATLASGQDPASKPTVTATLGGVGTANDTLSIGSVTLTLKAAAANEDEVTIGGSAAATAAAISAAINANSKLKGLVSASVASAVVTVTLNAGGRLGRLVSITKSSTAITLGAASFAAATTDTYGAGVQEYDLGVPT